MSETGAPMCRICGHSHWGRDPHVFKKPVKHAPVAVPGRAGGPCRGCFAYSRKVAGLEKEIKRLRDLLTAVNPEPVKQAVKPTVKLAAATEVNAEGFDRKAYMRQYMKDRRSKGKRGLK